MEKERAESVWKRKWIELERKKMGSEIFIQRQKKTKLEGYKRNMGVGREIFDQICL
jgi:hypothetical protein